MKKEIQHVLLPEKINRISLKDKQTHRSFHISDDPLTLFEGAAIVDGKRFSTSSRQYVSKYGLEKSRHLTHVVVQGKDVEIGHDPRPFVHHGRLHLFSSWYDKNLFSFRIMTWRKLQSILFPYMPWASFLQLKEGSQINVYRPHDDGSCHRFKLIIPDELEPGKNWSPFELPCGRLAFIHSFTPLIVLIERTRDADKIFFDKIERPGIPFTKGHGTYPAHRGGTAGLRIGNHVFGFGHTTKLAYYESSGPVPLAYDKVIHRPFFWRLDIDDWSICEVPIDADYDPKCFVIDPTSLLVNEKGDLELITTEVGTNFWDVTSSGCTVSYRVIIE